MSDLGTKKRIRITIDAKGNYGLEALEGFSGASCVEKTKDIELVLGGTEVDSGKTDAYFDPDDTNDVSINLD